VLIEHGADVQARTNTARTALFFAVDRGEVTLCELLIAQLDKPAGYANGKSTQCNGDVMMCHNNVYVVFCCAV
jgi:hypothetical protein